MYSNYSIGYKEKRREIVFIGGFQPIFSQKIPKSTKIYHSLQKIIVYR